MSPASWRQYHGSCTVNDGRFGDLNDGDHHPADGRDIDYCGSAGIRASTHDGPAG